jgi:endonuclease/exonuclease/phosphatase family metal-dependent hydrolase
VLRVMTWNLENLFKPGETGGPTTAAIYEAKLQGLAATINRENPDVISVQEVGNPDALDDLVALLNGSWHQQVSTHPDQRHIRVAWLSQRVITGSAEVVAFPNEVRPVQVDDDGTTLGVMGRGALAITVELDDGRPLRLITTHLKSKLLTFPGGRFQPENESQRARYGAYALYRRAAEAATLRCWADGVLAAGERLILTGDLNDTPEAATTQVLLGPPGSEIGTAGFNDPDRGDQQRLWNLAPRMPADANYSRINHGRKELIDHILVSAALVNPLDKVEASAVIAQPLPSVSEDPNARRNQPSSDHAPVVASFKQV